MKSAFFYYLPVLSRGTKRQNVVYVKGRGVIGSIFLTVYYYTGPSVPFIISELAERCVSGEDLMPVASCFSLMSHLGHLDFGTEVKHVLLGVTPAHMASDPTNSSEDEAEL